MKILYKKIGLFIALLTFFLPALSQISPENLKAALVYRIANCVKWNTDTTAVFIIGVLSDNQILLDKFNELSKVARINKKPIRIKHFSDLNAIQTAHILYVDQLYNKNLPAITKKQSNQNKLIITEEHNSPSDIMINLKLNKKTDVYTFEYNRANILFAGLDITDEIVLLKGTEIEIRELYLQAKKLWDEQLAVVAELKIQSEVQKKNMAVKNDSIQRMKTLIDENQLKIARQLIFLDQKDSLSNNLNNRISAQQAELNENLLQTEKLLVERNATEELIRREQATISQQSALSDSLTSQIAAKQKELAKQNELLAEKETLIKEQSDWLIFSVLVILFVIALILIISRALIINRRAKLKIAKQKEELEITLVQLKNMQQQLIQSEKMASLGVFIAGIAHEINNPINFISMGIDGIERIIEKVIALFAELNRLTPESKGDEIQKLHDLKQKLQFQRSLDALPKILENIKIGITRTIGITNGLRLYARMDTEEKSLCDINQIVETALQLLKSQINSQIAIQLNYGTLPQIRVFPVKLSQVFVNILSNAIDSIVSLGNQSKKASISITTREIDGIIRIEFSDTGKGIPTEVLPKIFDPFYTTKDVGKGTGLGMSIAKSIIEEHNGKISAGNNPDHGATFTIEMPINIEK